MADKVIPPLRKAVYQTGQVRVEDLQPLENFKMC
jgi:hypothetical protein